jgi:hypothetical protein
MENLKAFLRTKNPLNNETFGSDFKKFVYRSYHHGSAGYVLSNTASQRLGYQLVSNYSFCINTGIEDLDIAKCLRDLNIILNTNNHINGGLESHYTYIDKNCWV